jgi:hypothetical protein
MPTTIEYIIQDTRNELSVYESNVRSLYSTELSQDAIDFGYTNPNDAPVGSLERRLQALFFNISSYITSLEIDISDGLI